MSRVFSALRWLGFELKRRKVFRTGAAYAVGAYGLWQVVDLAGPALGWPGSILTYLVVATVGLFPLVLVLAWMFEIRREPRAPASESASAEERLGSSRPPLSLTIPAVLVSILLVWWLWPQNVLGVAGFVAGDRTLISPCENATEDPNLPGILHTALGASIRQSDYVEVVTPAQVRSYAESYMGLDGSTAVDASLARDYAVRTGLKVVILCSVGRVGDQYLLAASITDPREGNDLVGFVEEAQGTGEVLAAIDVLAGRIRTALGESLRSVQEAKPLAMVTTPSLTALTRYTASIEAEARGDDEEMRRLLELALSRDSLFARAHGGLAKYYYFRGNIPLAEEHYRAALENGSRIAERDRLWIEAGRASDRGEYQAAVTLYATYLGQWPSDSDGWYNLGTAYFRLTQCDSARTAFRQALALDPTLASAHVNLATCVWHIGQIDSALMHYDSAFRLQPEWREHTNLNHEYGQLLIAAGRREDAEALFSGQFSRSPSQQAQGHRSLALLRMLGGRYREARPLLEEAARQHQAMGQNLSEYRDRVLLSGVLEALADEAGARRERERVRAIMERAYISPAWSYHGFRLFLAAGDTAGAKAVLARAEGDTLARAAVEQASIHAMRAWMTLQEGGGEEAVAEAQLATKMSDWDMLLAALCGVALADGNVEVGEDACSRLARPETGTGWEGQEPSILANFWLGRLLEATGNAPEAAERYAHFLDEWGGGDPDLRFRDAEGRWAIPLEEARRRLAVLRGSPAGEA